MGLQGQAPLLDSLPEGCPIRTGFCSAVDQGQGAPQPRAQARGCGGGGKSRRGFHPSRTGSVSQHEPTLTPLPPNLPRGLPIPSEPCPHGCPPPPGPTGIPARPSAGSRGVHVGFAENNPVWLSVGPGSGQRGDKWQRLPHGTRSSWLWAPLGAGGIRVTQGTCAGHDVTTLWDQGWQRCWVGAHWDGRALGLGFGGSNQGQNRARRAATLCIFQGGGLAPGFTPPPSAATPWGRRGRGSPPALQPLELPLRGRCSS